MNTELIIKNKFIKVYSELDRIEIKITKKEGILFFKSHIFSIDELLSSEHHQKIDSITAKIGSDIESWYNLGKLDVKEEYIYLQERKRVDKRLRDINNKIESREPTWWEDIKEPCIDFLNIVLDNMPEELKRTLLVNIKVVLLKKLPLLRNILTKF